MCAAAGEIFFVIKGAKFEIVTIPRMNIQSPLLMDIQIILFPSSVRVSVVANKHIKHRVYAFIAS